MKTGKGVVVVWVTAPEMKIARRLAKAALEARLVACANLVPNLQSHYWWQGKVERSREVLVLFKTTTLRLAPLEKLVLALHPYDTPEFVALPVRQVNLRYLAWWQKALDIRPSRTKLVPKPYVVRIRASKISQGH